MATTPPSNSGQPRFTHVVFGVSKRDPDDTEACGEFEDLASAAAAAKQLADITHDRSFVVFEAVQVFAQVAKVELIYARRG